MGETNLIPLNKRTKDEQRKITTKGGIASGAARRKKRDMKQCMDYLLSLPASTTCDWQLLSDMGVNIYDLSADELNNMLVVNAALVRAAKNGDVSAAKELRSIIRDDEKLRLDRERLNLEKERLALEKERKQPNCDDGSLASLIEGLKR